MLPRLSLLAMLACLASLIAVAPASAGRYCSGSCDSYIVVPQRSHVPEPMIVERVWKPRREHRRVIVRERRVKRHHVKRRHVSKRRHYRKRRHVRRALPARLYAPHTRMHGRTRFCSDHVERYGHTVIRRCVQVRNDLLGRH